MRGVPVGAARVLERGWRAGTDAWLARRVRKRVVVGGAGRVTDDQVDSEMMREVRAEALQGAGRRKQIARRLMLQHVCRRHSTGVQAASITGQGDGY
jgi:hypothetical protein